jgi:hypothetical protein
MRERSVGQSERFAPEFTCLCPLPTPNSHLPKVFDGDSRAFLGVGSWRLGVDGHELNRVLVSVGFRLSDPHAIVSFLPDAATRHAPRVCSSVTSSMCSRSTPHVGHVRWATSGATSKRVMESFAAG